VAHVRLGWKLRSPDLVPGCAHVIASYRSRAAVWRCVGDGGSFRWIGPGGRGRGRELVSVSGSNHMGGSDDERVWEKKMMDHRQRKVKGVEVYITNDRVEK
jgi:hypothetical protein